jgi:restriction endonuclease Mrr
MRKAFIFWRRKELLPSGRTPIFDNRAGWALYYLKRAGKRRQGRDNGKITVSISVVLLSYSF